MLKPTQSEPEVLGGELGPLPIVMHYLRQLQVKEIIDRAAPPRGRQEVTHGECVQAILCAIFLGTHTLSHVAKTLLPFDLAHLFQHPGLTSQHFNDTRLGEALDALYGKTENLYADIVFRGIQAFRLVIRRIHTDSTTLKLYGNYDSGPEIRASAIKPPPIPAFGKSKDHRPDLKQLLLSLSVADGGWPLFGRVTDGNTSDVPEFRLHLEKLASMLEDLREIVLVADCKLCTSPTLALAHSLGFNLVTLVPETFSLRGRLIESACREPGLPLLLKTKDGEEYHGKSFKIPMSIETDDGRTETVLWRFLVVHSSQLARQRHQTRAREAAKEQKTLTKILGKSGKIPFACQTDAEKMASTIAEETKARFHNLRFTVQQREVALPGPKGRRPKDGVPQTGVRFFLKGTTEERISPPSNYDPEGMFVLLTTIPDRRELSDRQVLEAYKGQQVVEIGFHWLKGPLEVAPVFLKLPSRIDVLGFVYLVSMFLYALVQKDLRREVENRGVRVIDPCGQRTAKPTTRGLFKLFEGVDRVVIKQGSTTYSKIRHLDPKLLYILEIMGWYNLYFFENEGACT